MLTKTYRPISNHFSLWRVAIFALILFFLFVVTVRSQTKKLPPWSHFREVTLGMTMDQVHDKLGKPKSEDAGGLFYVFSETENAQILLDENGKVRTISAVFDGASPNAPTFEAVFGNTAGVAAPREDGSIFKLQRYEDLKFWISYNRMTGDGAMIVVMIQKF